VEGVHNQTTVYPADTEGLHKLACYLMRAPVNLSRLRLTQTPDCSSTSPSQDTSSTMTL
jgi:hypothetical protein